MKTKFIFFAFLFISNLMLAQSADNQEVFLFSYFQGNGEDGLHLAYSLDGLKWKALNRNRSFLEPKVGEDKLMRDPCIMMGPDNKYHLVWTISWKEKGIGYANSEDLINWSEQKLIPVMTHEGESQNCWAPEIFYDDASDMYMVFWSTTIPGRFPDTDSTGDNGLNHRMYYVTTRDLNEFSETRLLYDQGFNVIDGTLIKHDNKFILFLKNETRWPPEKNIRYSISDKMTGGYGPPTEPITGDYWAEGPSVIKTEGKWIVYFDKYVEKEMGAVSSTDLITWTDISGKVKFPKGTRHGTVFKVPGNILDSLLEVN